MSARLRGRVEKLEIRSGIGPVDEICREKLRDMNATTGDNIDVDAIPAGKACKVYIAIIGREVF